MTPRKTIPDLVGNPDFRPWNLDTEASKAKLGQEWNGEIHQPGSKT